MYDIYCALKERIPNLYPMKLYRCLKRSHFDILPERFVKEEGKIRKFKKYKFGYLHIDTLYVPKVNKIRRYIFTCIDRVSKLCYVKVVKNETMRNSKMFLKEVLKFYPYKINYILTDNRQEFCHNALPKSKKTKKEHRFVKICKENKIQHRAIKFEHPWASRRVDAINKKIKQKVLQNTYFLI